MLSAGSSSSLTTCQQPASWHRTVGTDSSGQAAQGDVQEQTSRPVCRGLRWLLVFGAQQPVGPAVPSNLCDDLSWAQSRRRVLPLCHPGSTLSEASPLCGWCAWLAVLSGEVLQTLRTRRSSVEPTTGHRETTEKAMCGSSGRRGPPGTAAAPWDGTSRGRLVLTPYHLRPARRLWLQVWVRVGCKGLNPC